MLGNAYANRLKHKNCHNDLEKPARFALRVTLTDQHFIMTLDFKRFDRRNMELASPFLREMILVRCTTRSELEKYVLPSLGIAWIVELLSASCVLGRKQKRVR